MNLPTVIHVKKFLRRYLLLGILLSFVFPDIAASDPDVVYIFVKISNMQTDEGIMKAVIPASDSSEKPTILFKIRSKSKHIREDFIHTETSYIFQPEAVDKVQNNMSIILKEDKLASFNSIDLNNTLSNSDKKSFSRFCVSLQNKKIFFIEVKEQNSGPVELIEVKYIRHLKY